MSRAGVLCQRYRLALRRCDLYHSRSGAYGYRPRQREEESRFELRRDAVENRIRYSNAYSLVKSYQRHGHRRAVVNPLGPFSLPHVHELDPRRYGLSAEDTSQKIATRGLLHSSKDYLTPKELIEELERRYCGPLAIEFEHLANEEEREWLAEVFETQESFLVTDERKVNLAKLMLKSQAFDHFLATKFTTVKRYGGEGCESMMAVFDELFSRSTTHGITDIVMCAQHRGRLNFLTTMLGFPPVKMFQKMKGFSEFPSNVNASGDVLSHIYNSTDITYGGKNLHISLIPNPSHLEASSPVAVGKTRAKQQFARDGEYSQATEGQSGRKVLCLQVHGDASFSAQGIISETFSLTECPHYSVGGSVHLIINNQVGFTTQADRGRSSTYCSDIAKVNGYPVLHVNAYYPQAVIAAAAIALEYQQRFHRDALIDLICFRRWGHNELDDPSFTQPVMYQVIENKQSIPDLFADQVVKDNLCSREELNDAVQAWKKELMENLNKIETYSPERFHLLKQWSGFVEPASVISCWDTGVAVNVLKFIGNRSIAVPSTMKIHPTILKMHIKRRQQKMVDGIGLDWATAEALAIGSLLYQGFNVRLSGQDVGRGTFSHRHVMIVDQTTDEIVIPLNHMLPGQGGFLEVANSVLSEEAVLGFEYGMSIENPGNLVIWEAQFGDFFNGAQIIIDTLISSGETKWLLQSGLVMLLPHGYDGAGPEHTSCRIERFLQMSDSNENGIDGDNVNMEISYPTTPAQYFHLLRQQMVRNYRKPLIIAAPKLLLRFPACVSSLSEMAPGTHYKPIIGETASEDATRLVFCSGKHYYALHKQREVTNSHNTAIVRLESLCPFPAKELMEEMMKYPKVKELIWSQEEHRNMGPWSFVSPRFENLLGSKLKYVGRAVLATPAVGISQRHQKEAEDVLYNTFQ